MIEGASSLVDAHTVEVSQQNGSKQRYTTKHILVATCSRTKRINIPGKVSKNFQPAFRALFLVPGRWFVLISVNSTINMLVNLWIDLEF
jgi:pyruvate/2-oxoglutarate dehydrogenase complex dihydrolipoamide dehydrogenase (E3) component